MAARPIEEMAGVLRDRAGLQQKLPVVGVLGPLIDLLVHTGDMRLPLGQAMPAEPALVAGVLDTITRGSPGVAPRRRLEGLRFVATDHAGTWGTGAEVRGELNDLLMAVCGRNAVHDRLDGPGVALLAQRS